MKVILVALIALVLGFVVAIPVGATQIEIAKRSLGHQYKAAMMVVAGSVASDILYGIIALYGLAPFMQKKMVLAGFEGLGALLLLILAFVTIQDSKRPKSMDFNNGFLSGKRMSFVTGFSLALTNPMMVFWWLLGMHFLLDFRLIDRETAGVSVIFLLFGGFGIAGYLSLLAGMLYRVNRFIKESVMQRVYVILGISLVLFSGYFIFRFIKTVN